MYKEQLKKYPNLKDSKQRYIPKFIRNNLKSTRI